MRGGRGRCCPRGWLPYRCRAHRLNYVSPEARFQGVSLALLHALEQRAAQRGNTKVTLESTETARRFYLSNGYTEIGKPIEAFGTTSYPMSKVI
ncbi:GNAT family N-acetyltransferase [Bradyrhizobium sp.]|uniref:GNAT family N-acetyltransferase n=1 Tax=Bradyrhizobium sp. TaxID=376 RepID=UPI003BB1B358